VTQESEEDVIESEKDNKRRGFIFLSSKRLK
jgi:hypothetical protein